MPWPLGHAAFSCTQMPTVHVLHSASGTMGVHTFTCKTWDSLLIVLNLPALTHNTQVVQVSQCCFTERCDHSKQQPKAIWFTMCKNPYAFNYLAIIYTLYVLEVPYIITKQTRSKSIYLIVNSEALQYVN